MTRWVQERDGQQSLSHLTIPHTDTPSGETVVCCDGGRVEWGVDRCSDCNIPLQEDQGERFCPECGRVFQEPTDHPDLGVDMQKPQSADIVYARSTEEGTTPKSSTVQGKMSPPGVGESKSSYRKHLHNSLRRARLKTTREKSRDHAVNEVNRIVGALGLPKAVEQTGRVIASQCFNKGIQGSWGVEYTAAATVVVASRLEQCPRTREEYVSVMNGSSRSRLDSAVADIKRRLDINLPPPDPESYLARFASQLDLTAQAEHEAKQLLSESSSQTIFSGNSPPKVAATALYAVSRQPGTEEVTQQEVAKETGVSVDTIRRLYNRFRDSL